MNLKQMKYAATLAQTGSFSGAAELLQISQPSLSQSIKTIEKELGVELFERTNGRVRITDAGKVYLEAGQKMLELETDMLNQLKDVADHKEGTITLGASPFRSIAVMPEVTRRFQELYPGIQLVIQEMATQELLEAAERNEFDLCLTILPVDERFFQYEVVLEEELGVAVKKGSELERRLTKNSNAGNAIDVSLLQGEAFVMLPDHLSMQKELNNLCYQNRLELKKAVVVKSLATQLEMVEAGVGSALVPMGIQKSARLQRELRFFSFLQELPRRVLVIAYQKGKYLSKPMQDLIEIFKTI
ncbi:MAG: LysR family transcriptional regulator [Clostridia bacterium]|nr:LysR family transcriptional regulator [Clostridia bacterium]